MKWSLAILLAGLIACTNQNPEKKQIETWDNRIKEFEQNEKSKPISISDIKSFEGLSFTSGVAKKDTNLCYPKDNGFLGFYFLLDKSEQDGPMGKLTIWSPNNSNWKFSDTNEKFVKLEVNGGPIQLWSQIGIGTSKTELKEFIGEDFNYSKGTILHHATGGYSVDYRILADTINSYTIKKECLK